MYRMQDLYPSLYGYDDTTNLANMDANTNRELGVDESVISKADSQANGKQILCAIGLLIAMVVFFGS